MEGTPEKCADAQSKSANAKQEEEVRARRNTSDEFDEMNIDELRLYIRQTRADIKKELQTRADIKKEQEALEKEGDELTNEFLRLEMEISICRAQEQLMREKREKRKKELNEMREAFEGSCHLQATDCEAQALAQIEASIAASDKIRSDQITQVEDELKCILAYKPKSRQAKEKLLMERRAALDAKFAAFYVKRSANAPPTRVETQRNGMKQIQNELDCPADMPKEPDALVSSDCQIAKQTKIDLVSHAESNQPRRCTIASDVALYAQRILNAPREQRMSSGIRSGIRRARLRKVRKKKVTRPVLTSNGTRKAKTVSATQPIQRSLEEAQRYAAFRKIAKLPTREEANDIASQGIAIPVSTRQHRQIGL